MRRAAGEQTRSGGSRCIGAYAQRGTRAWPARRALACENHVTPHANAGIGAYCVSLLRLCGGRREGESQRNTSLHACEDNKVIA